MRVLGVGRMSDNEALAVYFDRKLSDGELRAFHEMLRRTATSALLDVVAERLRQQHDEGWTADHDDQHDGRDLAFAACCYCVADPGDAPPAVWPWDRSQWKPRDERSNLVRAGALIIAEIERLDRRSGR